MKGSQKQKLLLAVGERGLEKFLKSRLKNKFTFTKDASYREIVLKRVREERPDIVLLREALKGSMMIETLVLDIREEFPEIRIVFYTSKSRPGEPLLRKLVSYGVYDIVGGEAVSESQIFDGLLNPKQLSSVRQYLDAPVLEDNSPKIVSKTEYEDLSEEKEEIEFEKLKPKPQKKSKKKSKKKKTKNKEKKGFFKKMFGRSDKKKAGPQKDSKKDKILDTSGEETIDNHSNQDAEYTNPLSMFSKEDSNVQSNQQITTSDKTVELKEEKMNMLEKEREQELAIQLEKERLQEEQRLEEQRLEEQRLEKERLEEERRLLEQQRLERERQEEERLEEQRLKEERRIKEEQERLEQERQEKEKEEERKQQLEQKKLEEEKKLKIPEIDFNPLDRNSAPSNQQIIGNNQALKETMPSKLPGWLGGKKDISMSTGQIITFVSAVPGVGNTHLAFNTALKLADEGNRVLYIDTNSLFASVDLAFQLGTWEQGIEIALEDISNNYGVRVSDNILRINTLKEKSKGDKQLSKLYKDLPDKLDYLFYSVDYQTLENQPVVDKNKLQELIMLIMTKERYDAIIVDSEHLGMPGVDGLLNISSKIYITMTQNPGQLGIFHRRFDAALKRVDITDNHYVVLNQYVDIEPKIKSIESWTNQEVALTVPFTHKEIISRNYRGQPFILKTKNKEVIKSFNTLAEHIAQ